MASLRDRFCRVRMTVSKLKENNIPIRCKKSETIFDNPGSFVVNGSWRKRGK